MTRFSKKKPLIQNNSPIVVVVVFFVFYLTFFDFFLIFFFFIFFFLIFFFDFFFDIFCAKTNSTKKTKSIDLCWKDINPKGNILHFCNIYNFPKEIFWDILVWASVHNVRISMVNSNKRHKKYKIPPNTKYQCMVWNPTL